ncbi:MAG TPA: hypothetical protein VFQ45_01830 [Longimicrobium sp.]|nr:hypothetical protein [Longimicrobium sp.]
MRPPALLSRRSRPSLPPSRRYSEASGACGAGALLRRMTPPDALPYSAEAGPRTTSARPRVEGSTWLRVVWPSGMVAGTSSTSTRTPRTPNCARAPKPRMEMRSPTA